jgi:hypothetical protein
MTSPITNRLFGTVLLLSSLQFGFAQSHSNILTFAFGPPVTPVWDISGTYQITNRMQGAKLRPMNIVFPRLILSVDAKGKVTGGTDTMVAYAGDDYIGGDYKVSGKITGGGEETRVDFTVKFKGEGIVAGVSTTCNVNAKYDLTILPGVLAMAGKTTGSAHFSNLGNGDLKSDIALPLPPGVDGGWMVKMDMYPYGRKLSGSAVVLVDTTPTNTTTILNTKVSGNVPKQSVVAETKLSGWGNSTGTKLNLEFTPILGLTNLAAKVNGKVLGQNVKN